MFLGGAIPLFQSAVPMSGAEEKRFPEITCDGSALSCSSEDSRKSRGRTSDFLCTPRDPLVVSHDSPSIQSTLQDKSQASHSHGICSVTAPLPPTPQDPPTCLPRHHLECAILESLSAKQVAKDLQQCVIRSLEMVDGMWWAVFPVCNSCGTCNPSCPHPRSEDDSFLYIDPQMTDRDGKVYIHLNCQLKIKETHANKWGLLKTAKKNPQSKERQEPECKKSNGWKSIPVEWSSWVPGKLSDTMAKHHHVGATCQVRGKTYPVEQLPQYDDFTKAVLCQTLERSVFSSMNMDQLMEDIPIITLRDSDDRCQELKSEWLICSVCGSCHPHCAHPPSLQDGTLLIYPRLAVRSGQRCMDLDFLLKMTSSHGGCGTGEMGEATRRRVPPTPAEKEREEWLEKQKRWEGDQLDRLREQEEKDMLWQRFRESIKIIEGETAQRAQEAGKPEQASESVREEKVGETSQPTVVEVGFGEAKRAKPKVLPPGGNGCVWRIHTQNNGSE